MNYSEFPNSYFLINLPIIKNVENKKNVHFPTFVDLSLKGTVNNLFNEEYLSVLSRPMPGINYEFFIGITPKWGKKKYLF